MAITKTKFINYIRCRRYVALDNLKKEGLESSISIDDYKEEEKKEKLSEILDVMIDEDGNDLIDEVNPQLEAMLPYYNKIEIIAGHYVDSLFNVKATYSKDTLKQESFDFNFNGVKYMCYVDIYFKHKNAFNIVEVKATTNKKFLELGIKNKGEFTPLFKKDIDGIYKVDNYGDSKSLMKLYDKYTSCGRYVYDLSVQRYIVENDLIKNNSSVSKEDIKYYLAVLNSDYVFDGEYLDDEPNYKPDINGNEIISLIDLTEVTKNMMDKISLDFKKVDEYIELNDGSEYPLGKHCEYKKTTKCKYHKVCFNKLPVNNSILKYIDNHHGFKDEYDNKYMTYDLINDGYLKMQDVPFNYLNRQKNIIQRDVVTTNIPYVNKNKIRDGINHLRYPLYHLDFETFPCPLPRLRGEKCYSQSVFQFSLHVESKPGVCDYDKDHFEFLAVDHSDNREVLVKKMCEYITDYSGMILVYNESFEKTRIKELAAIFPDYKDKLMKMHDMIFDLLFIVSTNSKFYESIGYSEEEAKMFNYYHPMLNGSFSIKKVLPLFSNLSYQELEVGNGTDAIVTYANFPKMKKEEFEFKYNSLLKYCKTDTWAMYEVLEGLKKLI